MNWLFAECYLYVLLDDELRHSDTDCCGLTSHPRNIGTSTTLFSSLKRRHTGPALVLLSVSQWGFNSAPHADVLDLAKAINKLVETEGLSDNNEASESALEIAFL